MAPRCVQTRLVWPHQLKCVAAKTPHCERRRKPRSVWLGFNTFFTWSVLTLCASTDGFIFLFFLWNSGFHAETALQSSLVQAIWRGRWVNLSRFFFFFFSNKKIISLFLYFFVYLWSRWHQNTWKCCCLGFVCSGPWFQQWVFKKFKLVNFAGKGVHPPQVNS